MPLAFLLGAIKKLVTPQQEEWFLDRSSLDVDTDLKDKGR